MFRLTGSAAALLIATNVFGQSAVPPQHNAAEKLPATMDEVRAHFADPDMRYAPFTFWFWDEPTNSPAATAKAAEMAKTMLSIGINPGYAHPRHAVAPGPSLTTDQWLSEGWFDAYKAAVGVAEKAHAYIGYCDEYWWPSLVAGGRVLEHHPELRGIDVRWKTIDVEAGKSVDLPKADFVITARLDQPIDATATEELPSGKWIWTNEKAIDVRFVKTFELPAGAKITSARFLMTVDDRFTVFIDGQQVGEGANWKDIRRIDVTKFLAGEKTKHTIAVQAHDDGGDAGMIGTLLIDTDKGPIAIQSDASWHVMGDLNAGDEWKLGNDAWPVAKEIGDVTSPIWHLDEAPSHRPAIIRSKTLARLDKTDRFTAPADGDYRVYCYALRPADTVNYVDTKLAPAFITEALEPYAKHVGDQMGKTILGDFIDNEGEYANGIGWSDALLAGYAKKDALDAHLALPLLADSDAEGIYPRVRYHWMEATSEAYCDNWKQVNDWHAARGMYCIANFWEETLQTQARHVGDHMMIQRTFTMPGTDGLGDVSLHIHDFKEAQSVSEFEGHRFMHEFMGAGDAAGKGKWGTFIPDHVKRLSNCITAWGVSHVVPHGVFWNRTLDGNPWPPDWYSSNPFFPQLRHWADFIRRGSFLNSQGHQAADVLLFYPLRSVWVTGGADISDRSRWNDRWKFDADRPTGVRANAINDSYSTAIEELSTNRIEYLITDEHYLDEMTVDGPTLKRGPFTFKAFVLPATEILPMKTAEKLVAFAEAGGAVYALDSLPTMSAETGANDPAMKKLMDRLEASPRFVKSPKGIAAAVQSGAPGLAPHAKFVAGAFDGMLQLHRNIDGRDAFFFANNGDAAQHPTLLLAGLKGGVTLWNDETGEVVAAPSEQTPEGVKLALDFVPGQASWVMIDAKTASTAAVPAAEMKTVCTLDGPWSISIDRGAQPKIEHPANLNDAIVTPTKRPLGEWSSFLPKSFSGRVDYDTSFTLAADSGAKAILDLGKVGDTTEAWLDGDRLGSTFWGPHRYVIAHGLKAGQHTLKVRVANGLNNSYGEVRESGLFGPVTIKAAK